LYFVQWQEVVGVFVRFRAPLQYNSVILFARGMFTQKYNSQFSFVAGDNATVATHLYNKKKK
jgi:hypothetical protein